MSMDQTQARRYAREVGGIACTRDTYHGRHDTTFEWGVATANGFVTSFTDNPAELKSPAERAEATPFNVQPTLTAVQLAEWAKLDADRLFTEAEYEVNDSDGNYQRREAAFDAEADWIEAEGLNYTTYDPRGLTDD